MMRIIFKSLAVSLVIALATLGAIAEQAMCEQKKLAENLLRFHVIANSDSTEDQALKLNVRDGVLDFIANFTATNLAQTKNNIIENLNAIEEVAHEIIIEKGYNYSVSASVANHYFPTKTYGDISLPQGIYEALRIEIGEAKGQNWWCVVYPNICFVSGNAVLPESSKKQLQGALSNAEYDLIIGKQPLKLRILEWFNK